MAGNELKQYTEVGAVARFYGFQPRISPEVQKHDFDGIKNFDPELHPAEKAALLRTYFEEKIFIEPQPVMMYLERPFKGSPEKKKTSKFECYLVSLGSTKSVCECLIMQAGANMLRALGYKDVSLRLNSIGDKDSSSEFEKKTSIFIRKNYNSFPSELRQLLKKDIFVLLKDRREEWEGFRTECPKPIDFLSETSRKHFKETLECLEVMGMPYSIDHCLIGDPHYGSETVFSFVSSKCKGDLAFGMRSNRLAKKLGLKKEVPSVFFSIEAKPRKQLRKIKVKPEKPQFFLVQFGPEAKLKSFLVLEKLRSAGASVLHSIAKDKLGSQIGVAENSGIPYILLLGQKEALENSVILRHAATHAQELIPIPDLVERIKKLK